MKTKTMLKLTALAALLTWGVPAKAGMFSDLGIFVSSAAYHIGYAAGGGSLRPAVAKDAVFISSGAAVIYSTSSTAGYAPFRVLNNAAAEILKLTQSGVLTASSFVGNLTGNVTGNVTGNATGTAGSLAANGANCSAGNYPLGVDASGAVESCTAAGIGDAVLAATQTFSGANTFTSTVTVGADPTVYSTTMTYTRAVKGAPFVVAYSSFTAASAVTFSDFRSSYTYTAVLDYTQNTSAGTPYLKFETGNHTHMYLQINFAGTPGSNAVTTAPGVYLTEPNVGTFPTSTGHAEFSIYRDRENAARAYASGNGRSAYTNNTNQSLIIFSGERICSAVPTSFTIMETAGTMTGKVTIWANWDPSVQ